MAFSISRTLVSAIGGGATAFLFAPVLWPLVVLASPPGGVWIFDSSLLAGLLAVAGFALGGGILAGLLFGFPLLIVFQKLNITNNALVIGAGGLFSVTVFSKLFSWPIDVWPLYIFLIVVGGLCSGVAVWLLNWRVNSTLRS